MDSVEEGMIKDVNQIFGLNSWMDGDSYSEMNLAAGLWYF